jgi:hypothetical protein
LNAGGYKIDETEIKNVSDLAKAIASGRPAK